MLQADTQLKTTQAQAIDVGVQRAQLEHAIALLIGKPPSGFSLPPMPLDKLPPAIPVGVPSVLLERRPDIAGAERRMASANAQIGVAIAAFYPAVTLTGEAGYQSTNLSNLFLWPSRFWGLGAAASEIVYEGGLRRAQTAAGEGGLRRGGRLLPPDGAHRLSAGRRQSRGAPHPGAGGRCPGGGGKIGGAVSRRGHQPVPVRDGGIPQRHSGPDNRLEQQGHGAQYSRPADDRGGAPHHGPGRRLGRRHSSRRGRGPVFKTRVRFLPATSA